MNSNPKNAILSSALLSGLIMILWVFPALWYNSSDPSQKRVWLSGQTEMAGWSFETMPVAKSAESVLVADQMISGEYSQADRKVRVFLAKRYEENNNDIGLFVHTPDRCWVQAGWRILPSEPDIIQVPLHGIILLLERRIFISGQHHELVFFGGLLGGQSLPYRLDHNLGVGLRKSADDSRKEKRGSWIPDTLLFQRMWESFTSRLPLSGPKQFIRISTTFQPEQQASADALLKEFLVQWLQPGDYREELATWQENKKQARVKQDNHPKK